MPLRSPARRSVVPYVGALLAAGAWLAVSRSLPGARGPEPRQPGPGPADPELAIAPELEGDPRLGALRAAIEAGRDDARAGLRRLGLSPDGGRARWRLAASAGIRREEPGATAFEAGSVRVRPDRPAEVVLPARRYLARPEKARAVAAHEAAHALLAARLGAEAYARLPRWLREGIALEVSREGPARVAARAALEALEGRPADGFLVGLPPAGRREASGRPTPAEGWLVVREVTEDGGPRALARLAGRLGRGAAPGDALRAATGRAVSAWRPRLLAASRRRLGRLVPPGSAARLARAVEHLGAGESATAEELLAPLAGRADRGAPPEGPASSTSPGLDDAESPAGALLAPARFFLARARLAEGQPERALAPLRALLAAPRESPWEPEALVLFAEALRACGAPAAARAALGEALERFPEDPGAAPRARRLLERLRRDGADRVRPAGPLPGRRRGR